VLERGVDHLGISVGIDGTSRLVEQLLPVASRAERDAVASRTEGVVNTAPRNCR
jgi:hypothetical protein